MAPQVEVVGMVYRSPVFRDFLEVQMYRQGWGIGGVKYRTVANDPVGSLHLTDNTDIYRDPRPDDHYLSRVYRCWNYCVKSSEAEYVCLVNSDMAFSEGWLDALTRRLDGSTLPTARLVEPGFLRPGRHAIEIDLGRDPAAFPWPAWEALAKDLKEDRTEPGGLYMPCVLHRESFLRCGGYPEGNVAGVSGDAILFDRMANEGFKHVTCFDSLVYHMQEGEMRYAL